MKPDEIINSYQEKLGNPPSLEEVESEREKTLKKAFAAKTLAQMRGKIVATYQILSDVMHGKRKLSASKVALLSGGLAYLALPVDIVCDVIPVVGLVDDGIVLTWIFSQCADLFSPDEGKASKE